MLKLHEAFKFAVSSVLPATRIPGFVTKTSGSNGKFSLNFGGKNVYDNLNHVRVVGFGKAAAGMALALQSVVGQEAISSGVLSVPIGSLTPPELSLKIKVHFGAKNNLPDAHSAAAAADILQFVRNASLDPAGCLLIVLITGGGSALLPMPVDGVSLEDKSALIRSLSLAGSDIQDLNTVRTHLSQTKGGKLARASYPLNTVSLIISDVINDPLHLIASGPTVRPIDDAETRRKRVMAILDKYRVQVPDSVADFLSKPPPNDDLNSLNHVLNLVVLNNGLAVANAAKALENVEGFKCVILRKPLDGNCREVGQAFGRLAGHLSRGEGSKRDDVLGWNNEHNEAFEWFKSDPDQRHFCVVGGGETTAVVKGNGKGGRNQEMALVVAECIKGLNGVAFLSGGTDGMDGPTNAAGASVDGDSVEKAEKMGLNASDFLANNDSFSFFERLGGSHLIEIGHTGTNVMDIQILLISK